MFLWSFMRWVFSCDNGNFNGTPNFDCNEIWQKNGDLVKNGSFEKVSFFWLFLRRCLTQIVQKFEHVFSLFFPLRFAFICMTAFNPSSLSLPLSLPLSLSLSLARTHAPSHTHPLSLPFHPKKERNSQSVEKKWKLSKKREIGSTLMSRRASRFAGLQFEWKLAIFLLWCATDPSQEKFILFSALKSFCHFNLLTKQLKVDQRISAFQESWRNGLLNSSHHFFLCVKSVNKRCLSLSLSHCSTLSFKLSKVA